jgi:AcrR family transcriptional regulator
VVANSGRTSASALRGEVRREAILRAALELFAEHGFEGTSLPMISEKVGITHAGILHHYKSKRGILEALVASLGPFPAFLAWLESTTGLECISRLPEFGETLIENADAAELSFTLFWENRRQTGVLHDDLVQDVHIRAIIAERIHEAVASGTVPSGVDADAVARATFGFVIGTNSQFLVDRDAERQRAAYASGTKALMLLLHARD